MIAIRSLAVGALSLLLAACVTINIYFPAAAAEQAADRIIQDVWGRQPGNGRPAAPPAEEESEKPRSGYAPAPHTRLAGVVLDVLIRPAHAQADINIATPAIDRIRASMRARHSNLEPHYASGGVGLTNDGLITIRDQNAVPLKDRTAVRQLVADENNDRNALYREIAQANGRPDWEPEIRATFARRWVDNAAAGWWYQDPAGTWRQK
jgi:uncharacterized protein